MIPVNQDNADEVARVTRDLLRPFAADEVKVKPAKVVNNRALALHYIDARHVMDRLDEVVGVNNWRDEYTTLPGGTEVECRLSVRIAGEWITKADVGGESEQPDEGDKAKAAYSDALKRAAVKFGVGRYLYRLPQTWMDYDPVKKQIVRPPAAAAPTQPPPTADQIAGQLSLVGEMGRWQRIVGHVAGRADLTAADKARLKVEAEKARDRIKAATPQPTPAGAN